MPKRRYRDMRFSMRYRSRRASMQRSRDGGCIKTGPPRYIGDTPMKNHKAGRVKPGMFKKRQEPGTSKRKRLGARMMSDYFDARGRRVPSDMLGKVRCWDYSGMEFGRKYQSDKSTTKRRRKPSSGVASLIQALRAEIKRAEAHQRTLKAALRLLLSART